MTNPFWAHEDDLVEEWRIAHGCVRLNRTRAAVIRELLILMGKWTAERELEPNPIKAAMWAAEERKRAKAKKDHRSRRRA